MDKHLEEFRNRQRQLLKQIEQQNTELAAYLEEHIEEFAAAAHRIDQLLPSSEALQSLFPDSFVIFKPKKRVGGDFYMVRKTVRANRTYHYLIIIDCTGHSAEGAMAATVFNQIISNQVDSGITRPSTIISRTHSEILRANLGTISADLAVVRLDPEQESLLFCGAMRPLLRTTPTDIHVLTPTRMRVGDPDSPDKPKDLTDHSISLHESDTIYIYSDGMEDQFGGPTGEKLKRQRLGMWLYAASHLPIHKQSAFLEQKLSDWKGRHPQVDDICLAGFRIAKNENR